jgi:hypothetical protein
LHQALPCPTHLHTHTPHPQQGELGEAQEARLAAEAQLAALQRQLEEAQEAAAEAAEAAATHPELKRGQSTGGASDWGNGADGGGLLPATPGGAAAAISNPVFSPEHELAELHRQVC